MAIKFEDILSKKIERRVFLKYSALTSIATALPVGSAAFAEISLGTQNSLHQQNNITNSFSSFHDIKLGNSVKPQIADGFKIQNLISWGDRIYKNSPDFAPASSDYTKQEQQFGYNNDYVAYFPLKSSSDEMQRGLLFVNHEYCDANMMLPKNIEEGYSNVTEGEAKYLLSSMGNSIIEISKKTGEDWRVNYGRYNRRISALSTEIALTGPAAGDTRLKTSTDKTGRRVIGTFANCAGGVTPWGTALTCEENFNFVFSGLGKLPKEHAEYQNHTKLGIKEHSKHAPYFAKYMQRFDVSKEPNEANRFGWVVEINPYNPDDMPKKRTALGRFKHEAAGCAIAPDSRVVVYMGDDERFQYLYRFVSDGKYDPHNQYKNANLLDSGVLYVAKFSEDSMEWIPLIYGQNGLDESNGFKSQADILIDTRKAGDIVSATPMDRPEDVEVNPKTGKIYAVMTNNHKRLKINHPNPRIMNVHGHIIELIPPMSELNAQHDHTAIEYKWEIFLLAGDNEYNSDEISCPDNICFDNDGNIWIATDGQEKTLGYCDSVYMAATSGDEKAKIKRLFNSPKGAEICGPCFTDDNETLFLAIQHPGASSGASYHNPSTRWPDFNDNTPPRPSIVAITTTDPRLK